MLNAAYEIDPMNRVLHLLIGNQKTLMKAAIQYLSYWYCPREGSYG